MSDRWIVELSWHEASRASQEGGHRNLRRVKDGSQHINGWTADGDLPGWEQNIEGLGAEWALSKLLNVYYAPGPHLDTEEGDVCGMFVRQTRWENGCLILHKKDKDARKHILMIGAIPKFRAAGWCYGHEGKRDDFWREPKPNRPAYFVPQNKLRPMDTLLLEAAVAA